jgi:hypothetical protein
MQLYYMNEDTPRSHNSQTGNTFDFLFYEINTHSDYDPARPNSAPTPALQRQFPV